MRTNHTATAAALSLALISLSLPTLPHVALAAAGPFPGGIAVTEILANVANESSDEALELLNVGSTTVDLAGWQLADNGANPQTLVAYPRALTIGRARTTVAPGKVALLLDKDYAGAYDAEVAASADPDDVSLVSTTGGNPGLANAADSVIVRAPDSTVSDDYAWTSDAGEGAAVARTQLADGSLAALSVDAAGRSPGFVRSQPQTPPPAVAPPTVRISELLPDPTGSDDGEFIELENPSSAPATLTELQVRDAGGTKHVLSGTLAANGFVALPKSATGITLNNDGDTVSLVWTPSGQAEQVLDATTYEAASEGASFARFTAGFAWTTTPTPGAANVLTAPPADGDGTPADGTGTPGTGSEVDQAGGEAAPQPQPIDTLAALQSLEDGTLASVTGTVATRSSLFYKNAVHVVDASGGVLVLPSSSLDDAVLDGAQPGDHGTFIGTVSHPASGTRLTLTEAPQLARGSAPKPVTVKLARLGRADIGRLVLVRGTVASRSSKSFHLADGTSDVLVSVRAASGISQPAPKKGAAVTVAGIVLLSSGKVVVAPRSPADLRPGTGELLRAGAPVVPLLLDVTSLSAIALAVLATGRRRAGGSGRSRSA